MTLPIKLPRAKDTRSSIRLVGRLRPPASPRRAALRRQRPLPTRRPSEHPAGCSGSPSVPVPNHRARPLQARLARRCPPEGPRQAQARAPRRGRRVRRGRGASPSGFVSPGPAAALSTSSSFAETLVALLVVHNGPGGRHAPRRTGACGRHGGPARTGGTRSAHSEPARAGPATNGRTPPRRASRSPRSWTRWARQHRYGPASGGPLAIAVARLPRPSLDTGTERLGAGSRLCRAR